MLFRGKRLLVLSTALVFILPAISSCAADVHSQASSSTFMPTRFTVVDEGAEGKPDVLLIPGLTSSREVWAAEAARLAPDYRLHLVQVNGFAGQPAGRNASNDALLPALVEQLHQYVLTNDMRPIVIGHSLGGLLTLMLAQKHPDDLSRIVIVDALPFFGLIFGPQATVESVRPMAKAMSDGALTQTPAQRESSAKSTAETLALNANGRRLVAEDSLASDPGVSAKAMYEDFQTDLRPELSAIKTPTLVLYAFDPTLTFPNGIKPTQEMADKITSDAYKMLPNVKLVRMDNSRHFIMFDKPQELHESIKAFLE